MRAAQGVVLGRGVDICVCVCVCVCVCACVRAVCVHACIYVHILYVRVQCMCVKKLVKTKTKHSATQENGDSSTNTARRNTLTLHRGQKGAHIPLPSAVRISKMSDS